MKRPLKPWWLLAWMIVLLQPASPARASELSDRIDAAAILVQVATPWITPELCEAMKRAEQRGLGIGFNMMPPTPDHPLICDLVQRVYYYDVELTGSFIFIDRGRVAGEGPDIEHLTFTSDTKEVAAIMSRYTRSLIRGIDKDIEAKKAAGK